MKSEGKIKSLTFYWTTFQIVYQNIPIILTSKNTKVSTQTDQQTINNIQISTASSNHRTVTTSEKGNDKNHKTSIITQLNSKTCAKTHVNKNSNDNTKEREPLDQADKKSESEEITEQSNPITLHKK